MRYDLLKKALGKEVLREIENDLGLALYNKNAKLAFIESAMPTSTSVRLTFRKEGNIIIPIGSENEASSLSGGFIGLRDNESKTDILLLDKYLLNKAQSNPHYQNLVEQLEILDLILPF